MVRAKTILDFIGHQSTAPTLNQISHGTIIPKPTTLKILTTLESLGMVVRTPSSKTYYLGMVFLQYSQKVSQELPICQSTHYSLKKLNQQVNETVNLGVVVDHQVVLIEKYDCPHSICLRRHLGDSLPLYASAMGKAILATYSAAELTQYIAQVSPLMPLGPNTITSSYQLQQSLHQTTLTGYAVDDEEGQPDVYCLGFALVKNQRLRGAFSIAMPKYRFSNDKLDQFIHAGRLAQRQIVDEL